MPRELDKLRELLVGAVVDAVDAPDEGVTEAVCKLTVRRGAQRHVFHLHATNLGWWVGEHQSIKTDPDGNEVVAFEVFSELVEQVLGHLIEQHAGTLEPLADVKTRRVGFRCPTCGQEWWVSMSKVRGCPPHIKDLLTTDEGRTWFGSYLGTWGMLPQPEDINFGKETDDG